MIKESTEDGKISVNLDFPAEFVATNDVLSIRLTPYAFRTAQTEFRWDFTLADLLKTKTLKLKKMPQAKKSVLQVH